MIVHFFAKRSTTKVGNTNMRKGFVPGRLIQLAFGSISNDYLRSFIWTLIIFLFLFSFDKGWSLEKFGKIEFIGRIIAWEVLSCHGLHNASQQH